ncbi:uncharacterized protein [Epargyreus clarus]|uniref:uncharacterized protein n=1 Tax=Epargyreus clarus TaxID=520877 RepID=UPI003C2CFBC3
MSLLIYLILTLCSIQSYVTAECPEIISRKGWDGLPPQHVQYLNVPLDLVVVQHTVTQSCSNDQSCAEIVRDIQKIHMEQAFLWDIGPSFLIGSNGKIYQGRGWNQVPIHTFGYNNQSFGIAFIGNFIDQEPSAQALQSAQALIQCGVEKEKLSANHNVVVQSQLVRTESPGKKLFNKIRTWPDWIYDVSNILTRVEHLNIVNEFKDETSGLETTGLSNKFNPQAQILTSPKKIDLLTNLRDVIAELLNNIRDLALQILKTIKSLLEGLKTQSTLLIDGLMHGVNEGTRVITSGVSKLLPFVGEANAARQKSGDEARACADRIVKEIENKINNLGTVASDAIKFTHNTAVDTKNCTELNFGIQENTEACLHSVTRDIRRALNMYETQRNNALAIIQASLTNLGSSLAQCPEKHNGNIPPVTVFPRAPKMCIGFFGC